MKIWKQKKYEYKYKYYINNVYLIHYKPTHACDYQPYGSANLEETKSNIF